jgi:hypothetical protein
VTIRRSAFLKGCLLTLILLVASPFVAVAAGMTPDDIKGWLALSAIPLMWVLGAIYTRWPVLKNYTNDATPWVNLVAFVFATYFVPAASAGFWDSITPGASLLWRTIVGGATSATASLLYDKFLKPILDRTVPAAVPDAARRR